MDNMGEGVVYFAIPMELHFAFKVMQIEKLLNG